LPPSGPKPGASTNFATRAGPNKKGEQAGMDATRRPDRPFEIGQLSILAVPDPVFGPRRCWFSPLQMGFQRV
jgi:hypothetical protein